MKSKSDYVITLFNDIRLFFSTLFQKVLFIQSSSLLPTPALTNPLSNTLFSSHIILHSGPRQHLTSSGLAYVLSFSLAALSCYCLFFYVHYLSGGIKSYFIYPLKASPTPSFLQNLVKGYFSASFQQTAFPSSEHLLQYTVIACLYISSASL